jgi:GR25 family glycosyltransferase involved in LPS biosynthesis
MSNNPVHESHRYLYKRFGELKKMIDAHNSKQAQTYPVFVLNRMVDNERMKRIARRCDRLGIQITRINAIDTMIPDFNFKAYREFIPETFWGSKTFKRGVIGCYLSHALAWQVIVERQIPFAVILEDDAYPVLPFPNTIEVLNVPYQFDIVFLNNRTRQWYDQEAPAIYTPKAPFLCYPYHDLAQRIVNQAGLLWAPGTEAYLISLSGAEKMLRIISEAKICCADDFAVAFHSMSKPFLESLMPRLPEDQRNGILNLTIIDVKLNTYVLLPNLVDHRDFRISKIDHANLDNRIHHSEMNL